MKKLGFLLAVLLTAQTAAATQAGSGHTDLSVVDVNASTKWEQIEKENTEYLNEKAERDLDLAIAKANEKLNIELEASLYSQLTKYFDE